MTPRSIAPLLLLAALGSGSTARVAVVEDRADLREGLVALLGAEPDFGVTGAEESMEAGLAGMGTQPPHVALIDLGLPAMNGIEGIRQLR